MSQTPRDRYTFASATGADEPEIRRLVGSVTMPGTIAVRFEREPDYFLGTPLMGDPCEVLLVRHEPDGALAGVLCRAWRTHLVNGEPRRLGWIGQVRAAPGHRGRWLMHQGLPLLRAKDDTGGLHLGVVARDNPRARAVMLERRPPGGLRARPIARLVTRALLLRRGQGHWTRRSDGVRGVALLTGASIDPRRLMDFLRTQGARRQLFPAWSLEDLVGGRTLRGLAPEDIAVAVTDPGGAIVGTVGCWDQRAFKQDVVAGYPAWMSRLRPAWNLLAERLSGPDLPAIGDPIPQAFAALICVADDDPAIFRLLLEQVARRAVVKRCGYLLVGLTEGDPLAAGIGRWPSIRYTSDLFAFSWTDPTPGAELDGRIPVVEIGTL